MYTKTSKEQQCFPCKNSHSKCLKTTNFDRLSGGRVGNVLNYAIDNVSFVFLLKLFCNMHVYSEQKSDEKVLDTKLPTVTQARGTLIIKF